MKITGKLLTTAAMITSPIILGLIAIRIEGELFTLGNMLSNIATAGAFVAIGATTIGLGVGALYIGYKASVTITNKSVEAASNGCQASREFAHTAGDKLSSALTSVKSYIPSWPKRGAPAGPAATVDEPRTDARNTP